MRRLISTSAILLTVAVLATPQVAQAQGHYSPASHAMAGARGTLFNDIDAVLVNPALLGMPGRRKFSLRLVGVSTHTDQNLLSITQWNKYMGTFLTESDKDDILSGIGDSGKIVSLTEVAALGIQVGSYAFSFQTLVAVDAMLPKDFLELGLRGTRLDRTYHFGDLGVDAQGVSVFGLSYGFDLPVSDAFFPMVWWPVRQLYGGVSLKYYMGHGYAKMEEGRADVHFSRDGLFGDAKFVYRTAGIPGGLFDEENDDPTVVADTTYASGVGSGIGIDVGIAADIGDNLSFHAAVLNISPGIKWSGTTYQATLTAAADTIAVGTFLEIDEEADTTDLDSLTSDDVSFERIGSFRTLPPLIVRLGGTLRLGRLALSGEFEQALSSGWGYNLVPRLAVGLEFRPLGFLPLRAGMSVGGKLGPVGAAGFGLDFRAIVLDFAVSYSSVVPGNSAKGLGVATGMKISF